MRCAPSSTAKRHLGRSGRNRAAFPVPSGARSLSAPSFTRLTPPAAASIIAACRVVAAGRWPTLRSAASRPRRRRYASGRAAPGTAPWRAALRALHSPALPARRRRGPGGLGPALPAAAIRLSGGSPPLSPRPAQTAPRGAAGFWDASFSPQHRDLALLGASPARGRLRVREAGARRPLLHEARRQGPRIPTPASPSFPKGRPPAGSRGRCTPLFDVRVSRPRPRLGCEAAIRNYSGHRGRTPGGGRPRGRGLTHSPRRPRAAGPASATRNVRDFEGCGVEVVDPWAAP